MAGLNVKKVYVPYGIYHIYNQGVAKQSLFLCKRDEEKFLKYMDDSSKRYNVSILKYALSKNHFHFVAKQGKEERSITKFMHSLGIKYVAYYNLIYSRVGPLFRSNYRARYIEKISDLEIIYRYLDHHIDEGGEVWQVDLGLDPTGSDWIGLDPVHLRESLK